MSPPLPLIDVDLERRLVRALIAQPQLHDTIDIGLPDLADLQAQAAFTAFANARAKVKPREPSVSDVRAELVARDWLRTGSDRPEWDAPDLAWFERLLAIDVTPPIPVIGWTAQVRALAERRAVAMAVDEEQERLDDEVTDFALRDAEPAPAPPAPAPRAAPAGSWLEQLLTKPDRTPRRAYHNTAVFVAHHPEFAGRWSYDEMTGTPCLDDVPMAPEVVHHIRAQADCRLGYTPPASDVDAAIVAAAKLRTFHPIRQYLRSLTWDGVPRLDTMARDYLGSDDPLHAVMLRKFMIGASARALWPGCKLDTALMLVGEQGLFKSTFFAVLGGKWHADSYIDITNKDGAMQLHSAWIYELSELENVVTETRESRLKAWITSTHDMFRAPYAKVSESKPRASVICGTTNRRQFLTDATGSRRFWIVPVDRVVPRDQLAASRDQLWAEAVRAADSGESWWLDSRIEHERENANKQFHEEDSWSEPITNFLSKPTITTTSITEVLRDALALDVGKHDRRAQMRAARVLKDLGWTKRRDGAGERHWYYSRPGQLL